MAVSKTWDRLYSYQFFVMLAIVVKHRNDWIQGVKDIRIYAGKESLDSSLGTCKAFSDLVQEALSFLPPNLDSEAFLRQEVTRGNTLLSETKQLKQDLTDSKMKCEGLQKRSLSLAREFNALAVKYSEQTEELKACKALIHLLTRKGQ